jgi:hypothetical protein
MSKSLRVVCVCLLSLAIPTGPVLARGHRGASPFGGGWGIIAGAAAAWAAQRAAWERREAAAEKIRKAKNNQERMVYAAQARKEGKPRLAATLYLRVALTRPKDKNNAAAKAALKDMAVEGRAEMQKGDELLAQEQIVEAFEKLDYLAWAYKDVPEFNHEIKDHVQRLHQESRYQAILNEKPAADLLAQAQKQEQDGERCCAYLTYEQAAELVPAPSALAAAERFEALQKDAEIVAEAKECQMLRECHHKFHTAQLMEKTLPDQAQSLFQEIIEKSPRDSEVHRCAKEELAKFASRR